MDWLSYVIVIIITAIATCIITENIVLKRIQYSPGVFYAAGRCRLKQGYGPLEKKEEIEKETEIKEADNINIPIIKPLAQFRK